MSEELNQLKTDIALIKKDIKQIERFFNKVDEAVMTMTDIAKNLAVQESMLRNTDQKIESLDKKLEDHRKADLEGRLVIKEQLEERLEAYRSSSRQDHEKLAAQTAEERKAHNQQVMEEIQKMNEGLDTRLTAIDGRVKTLEDFKWYILGIVAVITFIASQIDLAKFFS